MTTLKDLQPLTSADVTVGTTYIALCCALDTSLSVSLITPLAMWDKDGAFQARITYGDLAEPISHESVEFMESLGVPHKPRRYKDNYHRLFAYSKEAYEFFQQLCKEQRSVEWLDYLGVANPEEVIASGKRRNKTNSLFMRDALDRLINRDC